MIKKVDESNIESWAKMNVALFTSNDVNSFIEDYHHGKYPYEFLYYQDNIPVAFMSLSKRNEYTEGISEYPVLYLEGIYVLPPYRHQGIACKMIDYAISLGKEQGIKHLASDCEINNIESFKLHLKLGFIEVNRNIHFVKELK